MLNEVISNAGKFLSVLIFRMLLVYPIFAGPGKGGNKLGKMVAQSVTYKDLRCPPSAVLHGGVSEAYLLSYR